MKQKSLFSIKDVVAIGVGALFVVIAMLQIPAPAPNTSIQLQYALQALFSVVFGPIVGFLIGLIGHAIRTLCQVVFGGLGSFQVVCLDSLLVSSANKSVNSKGK